MEISRNDDWENVNSFRMFCPFIFKFRAHYRFVSLLASLQGFRHLKVSPKSIIGARCLSCFCGKGVLSHTLPQIYVSQKMIEQGFALVLD